MDIKANENEMSGQIFITMKAKISAFTKKTIKKDQTIKSLISSFRIENIHISESDAAVIYKNVETKIKKLAL